MIVNIGDISTAVFQYAVREWPCQFLVIEAISELRPSLLTMMLWIGGCLNIMSSVIMLANSGADNRVNRSNCDTSMKLSRNIYFM